MTIVRAYHALLNTGVRGSYIKSNGVVVYDNGWSFLVVFRATDMRHYAIIKYYNGEYKAVEL